MRIVVWDVEHGACAMVQHVLNQYGGRLAMIDCGSMPTWNPSDHITQALGRQRLDYLFITNADQDHMSDLQGLWDAGIDIPVLFRNPSYSGEQMREIKSLSGPLTADAKRYVAACSTYKVYGTDGRYVGTIDGDRLVYRSTQSAGRGGSFSSSNVAGSAMGRVAGSALWGDEPDIPD